MLTVRKTNVFDAWLGGLSDRQARARILARIDRLVHGNPGDVRPVGEGVSEMRLTYGPGYRIYYVQRGSEIVILLNGGTKQRQSDDIADAKQLAKEV